MSVVQNRLGVEQSETGMKGLFEMVELFNKVTELNQTGKLIGTLFKAATHTADVSSSAGELSGTVEAVAHTAMYIAEFAESTSEKAKSGGDQIDATLSAFSEIQRAFSEMKEDVVRFENALQSTKGLVLDINEIAQQTNILSLNASIEAARAGEHGRGFAIIAAEVRKLSDTTAASLTKITDTIDLLFKQMDMLVQGIRKTETHVHRGTEEAKSAHGILSDIIQNVDELTDKTENMASIAEEQAASTTDIVNNIQLVTHELENSSGDWYRVGTKIDELAVAVNSARIRNVLETGLSNCDDETTRSILVQDHLWWTWRVYNAIYGFGSLHPEDIGDAHKCRLGQWFDTQRKTISPDVETKFEEAHQNVHEIARMIALELQNGQKEVAELRQRDLEMASGTVVRYLTEFLVSGENL